MSLIVYELLIFVLWKFIFIIVSIRINHVGTHNFIYMDLMVLHSFGSRL